MAESVSVSFSTSLERRERQDLDEDPQVEHHELSPRSGHIAVPLRGQLYVWGGLYKDRVPMQDDTGDTIHIFDPCTKTWWKQSTKGSPPTALSSFATAYNDPYIYTFGGYSPGYDCYHYHGQLHQLDINSFTWSTLALGPVAANHVALPYRCRCNAREARIVYFEDKLVMVGGEPHYTRYGREIECYLFDLKKGE